MVHDVQKSNDKYIFLQFAHGANQEKQKEIQQKQITGPLSGLQGVFSPLLKLTFPTRKGMVYLTVRTARHRSVGVDTARTIS